MQVCLTRASDRFHKIGTSPVAIRNVPLHVEFATSIARDERAQSALALRSLYRLALACGIMIPHRWRARRSLKFMPKRGSDADSRIFFDELVSIAASRLKATGAIRLEDRHGVIAFGDKQKLVGVAHTKFPNGGSWSYFRLPKMRPKGKKALARRRRTTLQALPRKAQACAIARLTASAEPSA